MLEVLLYLRLFFDIAREVAAICSILIKRLTSSRSGLLPPWLLCTILHLMLWHCLHTFRLGFTTCYYAIRILDDMLLRLHELQLLLDVVVVVLMSTEIHHLYNTCCRRRRRRRIPELKGCNLYWNTRISIFQQQRPAATPLTTSSLSPCPTTREEETGKKLKQNRSNI